MDRDEVIALALKFDMRKGRRPRPSIPTSKPPLATRSDVEAAARLYDERLARASAYARKRRRDGKNNNGVTPNAGVVNTFVNHIASSSPPAVRFDDINSPDVSNASVTPEHRVEYQYHAAHQRDNKHNAKEENETETTELLNMSQQQQQQQFGQVAATSHINSNDNTQPYQHVARNASHHVYGPQLQNCTQEYQLQCEQTNQVDAYPNQSRNSVDNNHVYHSTRTPNAPEEAPVYEMEPPSNGRESHVQTTADGGTVFGEQVRNTAEVNIFQTQQQNGTMDEYRAQNNVQGNTGYQTQVHTSADENVYQAQQHTTSVGVVQNDTGYETQMQNTASDYQSQTRTTGNSDAQYQTHELVDGGTGFKTQLRNNQVHAQVRTSVDDRSVYQPQVQNNAGVDGYETRAHNTVNGGTEYQTQNSHNDAAVYETQLGNTANNPIYQTQAHSTSQPFTEYQPQVQTTVVDATVYENQVQVQDNPVNTAQTHNVDGAGGGEYQAQHQAQNTTNSEVYEAQPQSSVDASVCNPQNSASGYQTQPQTTAHAGTVYHTSAENVVVFDVQGEDAPDTRAYVPQEHSDELTKSSQLVYGPSLEQDAETALVNEYAATDEHYENVQQPGSNSDVNAYEVHQQQVDGSAGINYSEGQRVVHDEQNAQEEMVVYSEQMEDSHGAVAQLDTSQRPNDTIEVSFRRQLEHTRDNNFQQHLDVQRKDHVIVNDHFQVENHQINMDNTDNEQQENGLIEGYQQSQQFDQVGVGVHQQQSGQNHETQQNTQWESPSTTGVQVESAVAVNGIVTSGVSNEIAPMSAGSSTSVMYCMEQTTRNGGKSGESRRNGKRPLDGINLQDDEKSVKKTKYNPQSH